MRLRFLALCKIFAIEGHFCDRAAGHTKTLRVANIPMHNPQGVKRKFFYTVDGLISGLPPWHPKVALRCSC